MYLQYRQCQVQDVGFLNTEPNLQDADNITNYSFLGKVQYSIRKTIRRKYKK